MNIGFLHLMQLIFASFAVTAQFMQYFCPHFLHSYVSPERGPLCSKQKPSLISKEGGIKGGGGVFFSLLNFFT
jgi:hypothetical protein